MNAQKKIDPIAVGIKRIVKEKGFVKSAVAKRAGFTAQQFSDMLHDRKVIRAIDLLSIADALGVEIQDIYDAGKEEGQPED